VTFGDWELKPLDFDDADIDKLVNNMNVPKDDFLLVSADETKPAVDYSSKSATNELAKELGLPFKEPIKLDRKRIHKKNKWNKKYLKCKGQAKKDNKKAS
jgi:hypothetical protein